MIDDEGEDVIVKAERAPATAPPGAVDVLQEVVTNEDAGGLTSGEPVAATGNSDSGGAVSNDVVNERDVFGHRPRRPTILVHGLENDGRAVLRRSPVVLKDVALNQDTVAELQLQ